MLNKVLQIGFILGIVAVFCVLSDVAEARVVVDGLISYWTFDEDDIVELLITYKKTFWDKFVDNVLDIYFER